MNTPSNKASKDKTDPKPVPQTPPPPKEIGGRDGLDPVRYGDWEKDGKCVDF